MRTDDARTSLEHRADVDTAQGNLTCRSVVSLREYLGVCPDMLCDTNHRLWQLAMRVTVVLSLVTVSYEWQAQTWASDDVATWDSTFLSLKPLWHEIYCIQIATATAVHSRRIHPVGLNAMTVACPPGQSAHRLQFVNWWMNLWLCCYWPKHYVLFMYGDLFYVEMCFRWICIF